MSIIELNSNDISDYELKFTHYSFRAKQIKKGEFESNNLIYLGSTSFAIRSVSNDVEEDGVIPEGETVFNYTLTSWPVTYGSDVLTCGMCAYVRNGERYRILPAGTVSIPVSVLDVDVERYFADDYEDYLEVLSQTNGFVVTDLDRQNELYQYLKMFFTQHQRIELSTQALKDAEDEVLRATVETVLANSKQQRRLNDNRRWAKTAIELANSIETPLTVTQLADTCGTTTRTLQSAFEKTLGISPKKYLTYKRMQNIRTTLLKDKNTTVVEAASQFGVVHFGNFSKDYYQLFGEKPSETLATNLKKS